MFNLISTGFVLVASVAFVFAVLAAFLVSHHVEKGKSDTSTLVLAIIAYGSSLVLAVGSAAIIVGVTAN